MDCRSNPISIFGGRTVHNRSPGENSALANENMIQACKCHIDIFGRDHNFQRLYGDLAELKGYKHQGPPTICRGVTAAAQREHWKSLYPGTPSIRCRHDKPPGSSMAQETAETRWSGLEMMKKKQKKKHGSQTQQAGCSRTTVHASRNGKEVVSQGTYADMLKPPARAGPKQTAVVRKPQSTTTIATTNTTKETAASPPRKRGIRFLLPSEHSDSDNDEEEPYDPADECAIASDVESEVRAGPSRRTAHNHHQRQHTSTAARQGIPRPAFRPELTPQQIIDGQLRVQRLATQVSRARLQTLLDHGRERTAIPVYRGI